MPPARAGALHATGRQPRALDRAPTALAHQLPRAVGSAFSFTAVPAIAVGQARASLHGQHCGGLVHQLAGRYTITPRVTPRPPFSSGVPRSSSHCVLFTSREVQSCGRRAFTTALIPRRVATPSREDPADLESIRGSSGRPLLPPSPPTAEGPLGTDALAHSWPRAYASMHFPQ